MVMNSRFNSFINSELNDSDYMFIDPPWNYPPSRYKSEFWRDISFLDLFQNIRVSTIFMWVSLELIPTLISGFVDSSYDLKALIPYARVGKHEDPLYSLKHGFRNSLQYLAVFQTKNQVPIAVLPKTMIVETENGFGPRPVNWEDSLFIELATKQFKGIYLLPDGKVADTDITGKVGDTVMSKKELF